MVGIVRDRKGMFAQGHRKESHLQRELCYVATNEGPSGAPRAAKAEKDLFLQTSE